MFAALSPRILARQNVKFIRCRYLFNGTRYRRNCGPKGRLHLASTTGIGYLRHPRWNKDLAFTVNERQSLGLHGLLPSAVRSQDEQVDLCKISLDRRGSNLGKCSFLYDLQGRNERLFYRLLAENISELLPIVYLPTITQACEKCEDLFAQPRGLYINIYDRGHISEVLMNWEETDVRAVVVTDGESLTNAGDLGALSMAMAAGKTVLYTTLGGVKPHQCLPVTLDVGTNNEVNIEKLLKDPLYVGLRHHRTMGPTYQEFVDEFVDAIVERFGQSTVIQFEGFDRQNSSEFLRRYQRKCCTFSDELQAIGAVALAGLLASESILDVPLKDYKILFLGADESTFAIANMTAKYLEMNGVSTVEAKNKMWIFDEHGLLARSRPEGDLTGERLIYSKDFEPTNNPIDVIKRVKPNVLIGTSGTSSLFAPDILYRMAEVNQRPLIFAMTDPGSKNECTAEDVFHHTQGRAIFVTGSPFPFKENYGKNCVPNHASSCLLYPGLVLGTLASGLKTIKDDIFPILAKSIADNVREEDLQVGRVFPPLERARDCSIDVAAKVCDYAYDKALATYYPEPQDKKAFVKAHLYNYNYKPLVEDEWDFPEVSLEKSKKEYCGKLRKYFLNFNKSAQIFNLNEGKSEKTRAEINLSNEDLDEIKIVERLPPETLKTTKPDPTT